MKQILAAMAFLATLTCANLSAQSGKVTANIPFDFQMGSTMLPAGEYTFYENGHILTARRTSGGRGAMILTMPAWHRTPVADGTVQFQRYGDAYFLSGLWTANSQDGFSVPQSSREKELARRVGLPQATSVALSKH
ncbi:MAG TPA: hypothetical protein VKB88_39150 [Bryobacteraceae bacterium]|nr:hypothetical protein [Bryobacteraceae bacterium]